MRVRERERGRREKVEMANGYKGGKKKEKKDTHLFVPLIIHIFQRAKKELKLKT